jgi:polar amino acid transport system substrate-binding protein
VGEGSACAAYGLLISVEIARHGPCVHFFQQGEAFMKRLAAFLFLVLSALPVSAPAETVINGIDKDYPPFAYIDEKGKVAGFDVDSMDWIARKMGFTVEHKAFEWKTIVQMVVENKIQMVCSGMSITPERAREVLFSDPYWTVRKVLMVRKGSDLNAEKILNGKVLLGVQQGTNEDQMLQVMLKEGKGDFTLKSYATPSDGIADVLNGRIAAMAMDSPPAHSAVRAGRPVQEAGTFGEEDHFGVAVNRNNPDLVRKINEGYKLLKADPYWKELQEKYNP